jgi:hypothetical protein
VSAKLSIFCHRCIRKIINSLPLRRKLLRNFLLHVRSNYYNSRPSFKQDETNIVGSVVFPKLFPGSRLWHHLAVNCSTKASNGDQLHLEVFLDGEHVRRPNSNISLKAANQVIQSSVSLTEADTQRLIHVGQLGSSESRYKYSHVFVFRALLSKTEALFLYLLGPCVTTLEPLKCQGSPFLQSPQLQLVKRVLQRDPTWSQVLQRLTTKQDDDNVLDDASPVVEELASLHSAMLAIHSAPLGQHLIYYPPPDTGRSSGLLSSLINATQQQASNSSNTNSLKSRKGLGLSVPASNVRADVRPTDSYSGTWCSAIEESGGFGVLLLLLAHTVEIGGTDRQIAVALDSILKVLEDGTNELLREAAHMNAWSLIVRILKSKTAVSSKLGLFSLKVMLDYSLTQPILLYDAGRDLFRFAIDTIAVVYNGNCLGLVLECWPLWRDCRQKNPADPFSCLEAVLACLVALLQDTHVHRDINVDTLRQLNVVQKLAFALKNDMDEKLTIVEETIVSHTLDVFSGLVGSPPNLEVVNELMQVSLFLHESDNTYINHSRNTFYFSLPTIVSPPNSMTWPRGSRGLRSVGGMSKSASFNVGHFKQSRKSAAIEAGNSGNKSRETSPTAGTCSAAAFQDDKLHPERQKVKSQKSDAVDHVAVASPPSTEVVHFGELEDKDTTSCLVQNHDDFPSVTLTAVISRNNSKSDSEVEQVVAQPTGEVAPKQPSPPPPPPLLVQQEALMTSSISIVEGIVNILHGSLINMPDSSVTTAMTSIILPEYILALVNHPSGGTRCSATRLLVKYVQRTCRHYPNGYRLDKIEGYQLLATQLFSWGCKDASASLLEKVAAAVLSLVHGVEVGNVTLLPEVPARGAKIRSAALPPLLALLPSLAAVGIVHVATAHALIVHLHDIVAR